MITFVTEGPLVAVCHLPQTRELAGELISPRQLFLLTCDAVTGKKSLGQVTWSFAEEHEAAAYARLSEKLKVVG